MKTPFSSRTSRTPSISITAHKARKTPKGTALVQKVGIYGIFSAIGALAATLWNNRSKGNRLFTHPGGSAAVDYQRPTDVAAATPNGTTERSYDDPAVPLPATPATPRSSRSPASH